MEEKAKGSKGALVVETILILFPFMLAFFTIINMARFIQTEMIIHHAITQTAKEISTYGYVLNRTGVSGRIQSSNEKSEKFEQDVNQTVSSVEDFVKSFGSGDASKIQSSGQQAYGQVSDFVADPSAIVSGIFSCAKSKFEGAALTLLVGQLTNASIKKQLSLMTDNPDEYLKRLGVVDGIHGLHFEMSRWISNKPDEKPNIDIVVHFTLKNNMVPIFDFGEHEFILSAHTLTW